MHYVSIRDEALKLRKAGYSYSYISEKIDVSKSTLSGWLASVPYSANKETIDRIGKAIVAANAKKIQIRQEETEIIRKIAKKDIGKLSKRDLLMFGLGLYLGEGGKTHDLVRITNSDPLVIRAAVAWFISLGVRREQFTPRIHIYPDSNEDLCLQFWSRATSIPKAQFHKSQVDWRSNKKTSKKGKLPFGTLHLGVKGNGRKEYGVQFHRKIQAWNASVLDQLQAGLV